MNLFETLSEESIQKYADRIIKARESDLLIQSPQELGRWLALISLRDDVNVYMEIGTSAGGTFRLTREVLLEKNPGVMCIAVDDGSDVGFRDFLPWYNTNPNNVILIQKDIDGLNESIPPVDLCLLDAAHTYELTKAAFQYAAANMFTNGLIAFHDTTESRCPGVGQAVEDISNTTDWKRVAHFSNQFGFTVLGKIE